MADLYDRLSAVGFPAAYVRTRILPDWWDDDLASESGNRRLAEMAISRTLKIPLANLADHTSPLTFRTDPLVRFKRWQGSEASVLVPAVAIARRASELLLASAIDLPRFALEGVKATALRDQILASSSYVTLTTLIDAAWSLGVPVLHLQDLPTGSRRVDGMALNVNDRPCVVLSSSQPSPAWLAWHLAHEMGHVAEGHLKTGDAIDISIEMVSDSKDEREANNYASILLYGDNSGYKSGTLLDAKGLARQAQDLGPQHRVHPACIVTSYGYNMRSAGSDAWSIANGALKILGLSQGGSEPVRKYLPGRLDLDRLTETDRRFLAGVTGLDIE